MNPEQHNPENNNTKSERGNSPDYIKTLATIESLIGSESGQEEYIENRLSFLEEKSSPSEISHLGKGIHRGFLGSESRVKRNIMVDDLVVDDPSLYKDLFETIELFKRTDGWKEKNLREIIPPVIQRTLSKYFGNIAGNSNTEELNRQVYLNHTDSESHSISIKEFKGKGISVCAEKAAAAQNLLAFVGLDSDLVASTGSRIPATGKEVPHYYNVIHGPDGDMIYDPTNPRLKIDREGNLKDYLHGMYPLSNEQNDKLLSGGNVMVQHEDFEEINEGEYRPKLSTRIYSGPRTEV